MTQFQQWPKMWGGGSAGVGYFENFIWIFKISLRRGHPRESRFAELGGWRWGRRQADLILAEKRTVMVPRHSLVRKREVTYCLVTDGTVYFSA